MIGEKIQFIVESINKTQKEFDKVNNSINSLISRSQKLAASEKVITRQLERKKEIIKKVKLNIRNLTKSYREGYIDASKYGTKIISLKNSLDSANYSFETTKNRLYEVQRQYMSLDISLDSTQQKLIKLAETKSKLNGELDGLKAKTISFRNVLDMTDEEFKRLIQSGHQFNTMGGKFMAKVRLMTVGLHGFRMEMLSVMFFGMMMSNFFKGLLQPAADSVGIFDLWSTILEVTFLPIMLELLPYFLQFMEFMINLPEPVQKVIGAFALFGLVAGYALAFIGQMVLGIGGLIQAFPLLSKVFGLVLKLGPLFKTAFGVILKIVPLVKVAFSFLFSWVGVIVGLIIWAAYALWRAWDKNLYGIKDSVAKIWKGIKKIWTSAFDVIQGAWEIVVGIFTGDFDKIKAGFEQMWDGAVGIVEGVWDTIVGVIETQVAIILGLFTQLWEDVKSSAGWLWGKAKSLVGMGDSDGSSEKVRSFNDVILRPGQAPIQVSRNDTIVAAKSGLDGGTGGSVTFAPVFNVNVSDKAVMEREMARASQKMMDDLRRVLKVDIR